MVCVGLSERDLKNFAGATGGQAKFWGGIGPPFTPLAPPWSLLTKHSAEEWVYLRKYVKYGAGQMVEMNHNEDSLFMALGMDYCYVWFITQNVWSRFQIARGESSFCLWAAVQTKSTRFSSHLVLLMLGDRRFFRQFRGRRNFRWDWAFVETFFMLVFMSKIRVMARLTSLHCSQGYRFSVEPNVNSL